MRDFLLANCSALIWCITAIELLLFVVFIRLYKSTKKPISLCMAFITLGLFIDAFLIVMGSNLPTALFMPASRLRFISHGILIPLLFPICAYALDFNDVWKKIIWVFTVALMVAGLAEALAVVLDVKEIAGVLRCTSGEGTPGWAEAISAVLSYGTVVPLILSGIIVWCKKKTPALFLSGFLMFAFSALGPATGNFDLIFFISMFGEVFMVFFFWVFARREKKNQ